MTLIHDGKVYAGWTSITVEATSGKAARGFSVSLAEFRHPSLTDPYWIAPGDAVEVFAGDDLLLSGYVNQYDSTLDANSHSITITGRSKSQDAVDSSASHGTGRFENMTVGSIASELAAKVGVTIDIPIDTPKVPKFQINIGETVVQAINRLGHNYGLQLSGLADGNMRLSKGGSDNRYDGFLIEGFYPIKSINVQISDTKKFQRYEVRSQLAGGEDRFGVDAAHEVAEVIDGTVKRLRKHICTAEIAGSSQNAQDRAEWQARRIAGKSVQVNVVAQGFWMTDDEGNEALWEPGKLIYLRSPTMKIDHELMIESVTYIQDGEGTRSEMKLVAPAASGSKGGKKKSVASATEGSEVFDGATPEPVAKPKIEPPTPFINWDTGPI